MTTQQTWRVTWDDRLHVVIFVPTDVKSLEGGNLVFTEVVAIDGTPVFKHERIVRLKPGRGLDRYIVSLKWLVVDMVPGERVCTFDYDGHTFTFRETGLAQGWKAAMSYAFQLTIDGQHWGVGEEVELTPELFLKLKTWNSSDLDATSAYQVLQDDVLSERFEVVGIEEFGLGNKSGTSPLTTTRELSRTTTNEVSVTTTGELDGSANFAIGKAVKADVSAKLSRETGQKFNESFVVRHSQTFTVNPGMSVTYRIKWKRRVRNGQCIVRRPDSQTITIAYQACFDLSFDIETV